jgi:hypothetical protein
MNSSSLSQISGIYQPEDVIREIAYLSLAMSELERGLRRSQRGAGRFRRAPQHEMDRRAVLDDAEHDRYSIIVEPDFPSCDP